MMNQSKYNKLYFVMMIVGIMLNSGCKTAEQKLWEKYPKMAPHSYVPPKGFVPDE